MNINDIEKIHLYAKNLGEPKYEFLIKKHEDVRINYCNDPNAFTECSNTVDDVYENINYYNPNRRRKILIVFDDVIADMSNKKFQAIIKELFIRCRKDVRLNLTHYLIMKINNRKELQILQIIFWQILIIKILWVFTENAQENCIIF